MEHMAMWCFSVLDRGYSYSLQATAKVHRSQRSAERIHLGFIGG